MHGDANSAFEASMRQYLGMANGGGHPLAGMLLEQLLQHAWVACRYPEALPIAEAYYRKATSGQLRGASAKHAFSALLSYAHLLATVGRSDYAHMILNEAEGLNLRVHIDDMVRLLHERAYMSQLLGCYDSAAVLFQEAAETARRHGNSRLKCMALRSFAVHMRYCGRIEESLQLHREATAFAEQQRLSWRRQCCILSHGLTLFFAGRLDEARSLLLDSTSGSLLSRQGYIIHETLALLLGVATGEAQVLEGPPKDDLLNAAFGSGEPPRIIHAIAAMHRYYLATGRVADARSLLERSQPFARYPHWCALLYLDIAKHGSRSLLEESATSNSRMSDQSSISHAFKGLLRTRLRAPHNGREALNEADRAAVLFGQLSLPLHRAAALELTGRYREAGAVYTNSHAHAEARRAREFRGRPGRPRRVRGQLTIREREIAKLCLEGIRRREIAARLGIAVGTVDFHVRNVLRELDLTSRYELRYELLETR